jgi:hypothetical protein
MKRFTKFTLSRICSYSDDQNGISPLQRKFAVFLICQHLRSDSVQIIDDQIHTDFLEPISFSTEHLVYLIDKYIFASLGKSDPSEFRIQTADLVAEYLYTFELELTGSESLADALE